MTHDELLYDYLDELLEGEQVREAEAAIAADPSRFAEIARRRAMLYRPYAVPAPPRAQRPTLRLVRYAAVFLLGVLTPMLLPLPPKPPDPQPPPAKIEVVNRRLR